MAERCGFERFRLGQHEVVGGDSARVVRRGGDVLDSQDARPAVGHALGSHRRCSDDLSVDDARVGGLLRDDIHAVELVEPEHGADVGLRTHSVGARHHPGLLQLKQHVSHDRPADPVVAHQLGFAGEPAIGEVPADDGRAQEEGESTALRIACSLAELRRGISQHGGHNRVARQPRLVARRRLEHPRSPERRICSPTERRASPGIARRILLPARHVSPWCASCTYEPVLISAGGPPQTGDFPAISVAGVERSTSATKT